MLKKLPNKIFNIVLCLMLSSPLGVFAQPASFNPVTDGNDAEWPQSLIRKDSAKGLDYALTTEKGIVHVLVLVKDPLVQTKVLNAGMELGFDLENKQKPTQVIQFPLSKVAEMFSGGGFSRGTDMEAMRLLSLMKAKEYSLKKFNKGNGPYTLGDANDAGVALALAFNEKGQLVYEAAVPQQSLLPKKGGDGMVVAAIGLDIEIHGIEPPSEMPSYNAQPPAGGRGGGGRGGAGGSGVPAGGGGRGGPGGGVRFSDGGSRDGMMKKMQEAVKVFSVFPLK